MARVGSCRADLWPPLSRHNAASTLPEGRRARARNTTTFFDDAEMASPQRYACVSVRETPGARAARHKGYGSIAATLLLACQC